MSVSVTLKDWLLDKIGSISSVQEVYGYEPDNFEGYPAVTVTLPTMEGEFASTSEDARVYAFAVRVFLPLGQDIEKPKTLPRELYAENVVATVIEEIINTVDTDFAAADVTRTSNINCLYIEATDMQPLYALIEGGWFRGAEVTIRIYTEKVVV